MNWWTWVTHGLYLLRHVAKCKKTLVAGKLNYNCKLIRAYTTDVWLSEQLLYLDATYLCRVNCNVCPHYRHIACCTLALGAFEDHSWFGLAFTCIRIVLSTSIFQPANQLNRLQLSSICIVVEKALCLVKDLEETWRLLLHLHCSAANNIEKCRLNVANKLIYDYNPRRTYDTLEFG